MSIHPFEFDDPLSNVCGNENFRIIFDAIYDGLFITNAMTGQVMEANQSACRMFGYSRAELLGRNVMEILSSGIAPYTEQDALQRIGRKWAVVEPGLVDWQGRTKDGHRFWMEVSVCYLELQNTPVVIAILRDTTERKQLDAEILFSAQYDSLTGLVNRATFKRSLEYAIEQSMRTGRRFAVLSLDLDNFKDVNDTRGHLAGDLLLRLVAERLNTAVGHNVMVARFGGDEFSILIHDCPNSNEVDRLSRRIIASMCAPFIVDGCPISIGISIGVLLNNEDTTDAEITISQADMALHRAKAEGRNTYRFFSERMNQEVRLRIELTDELRTALSDEQLFLAYQPQVSVPGGLIVGVESLVRWNHPRRGVLLPKDFLPIAESSGLMGDLGRWVLREACRQGREWIDDGTPAGTISVNLCSDEFRHSSELVASVVRILDETGFPAELLELEITETTLIGLSPGNGQTIEQLRRLGVRFALDDFGTGYSSLNYLRRFPIDRIKIPREFVSEVTSGSQAASIVKVIIGLSRDIGSKAIAEGVETTDQLRILTEWGCKEVQGFYFARPMSAEGVQALLKAGRVTPEIVQRDPGLSGFVIETETRSCPIAWFR